MRKIAIITGATGGIGKEFVKQILKEDLDEIWAVGRNSQKLEGLKEVYGEKIVPVSIDLSEIREIENFRTLLADKQPFIQYLINNAGLARMGASKDFSPEEISRTIDINCKAPVILSNLCIPYMGKGSKIMNISSASAFQPNPYINLYAATKVFERNYSRAQNAELQGTGITVTAVCSLYVKCQHVNVKFLPQRLVMKIWMKSIRQYL